MKQLIRLMGVLFASSALATGAFAGTEMYSGKESKAVAPAPPECDFNWTGFYVGLKGGYGWGNGDFHADQLPDGDAFEIVQPRHDLSADGVIGGAEVGFNWQWNHFVLGAAADFFGSDMSDSFHRFVDVTNDPFSPALLRASEDIDWFGTVRGRIGFVAACRFLIYGTGGFAYANVDDSANLDYRPNGGTIQYPASRSDTETGWTAGGGLEYAIGHHWSIKAEYLYVDVGDDSKVANPVPTIPTFTTRYNWDHQFHTVTAGLNFKF